jgi:hypothetical protein
MDIYFDRQGKPISADDWLDRQRDDKRVAQTTITPLYVSTVWLGIDHGMGFSEKPLIFETMIFPSLSGYWDRRTQRAVVESLHPELRVLVEECWRYSTVGEALAGHDNICVDIRTLVANIAMAEQILRDT